MKIAAKLLRDSDLTLFRTQYERLHEKTKQKAINLNADVFVNAFFPGLKNLNARYSVSLAVFGPGQRSQLPHTGTATVLKQQKNWRLDGRLIEAPTDEPERFAQLAEGDLVLIGFDGDLHPTAVFLVLVSSSEDAELHSALSEICAFDPSSRNTMRALTALEVESLKGRGLEEDVLSLVILDVLDDGTLSTTVSESGLGAAATPDDAANRSAVTARIGRDGEGAFESWLLQKGYSEGDFDWVASHHAFASFDFKISRPKWSPETDTAYVDVKSTKASHERRFYLSRSEAEFAAKNKNYFIARVSELTSQGCKLSLLGPISELAQEIVDKSISPSPDGVSPDSFLVLPEVIAEVLVEDVVWKDPEGD